MRDLISAKQSLDFQITIKRLRYHLVGLISNIFYDLFIVDKLYEDISQILSHQFYLSIIKCTYSIFN